MLELDRAQVLATRVEAHHLNRRLDTDSSRDNAADSALVHGNPPSVRDDMMYALIESAAVCGVRDVQQSGILAFHARINGVHHDDLERTLDGRQLVKVASARGNISIVPARDVAVFTLGVLPGDEGSLRTYLKPFLPVLDESGMSAQGALDSVCEAAAEALADGPLDSAALSAALTAAAGTFGDVSWSLWQRAYRRRAVPARWNGRNLVRRLPRGSPGPCTHRPVARRRHLASQAGPAARPGGDGPQVPRGLRSGHPCRDRHLGGDLAR
jgi:hypothetical protein